MGNDHIGLYQIKAQFGNSKTNRRPGERLDRYGSQEIINDKYPILLINDKKMKIMRQVQKVAVNLVVKVHL